jgi:hypothetical protein
MRLAMPWSDPPYGLEDTVIMVRNLTENSNYAGEAFITHNKTYAWDISIKDDNDSWSSCGAEPTLEAAKAAVDEWLLGNGFEFVPEKFSIMA